MVDFLVERTAPFVTFALRQRVLRPHQRPGEMALPGDDQTDTAHLCALDPSGRVLGTGNIRREAPPWDPGARGWRMRGMATEPQYRSQGIGAAVLAALLDHVADHGGGLVWCSARAPAVDFYRRAGFLTHGEVFEEPFIGPHVHMSRAVEQRASDKPSV